MPAQPESKTATRDHSTACGHHHAPDMDRQTGTRLLLTLGLNLIIPVAQIIGGIMANSMALISDATHNFSDFAAILIAYLAYRIARRGASVRNTFGYRRAEVLAALINVGLLVGAAVVIVIEAVERVRNPAAVAGGIVWVGFLIFIYIVLAGWTQTAAARVSRLKRDLKATEESNKEYFALEGQVNELEAKQRSLTAVVGEQIISVPVMAEVTRMVPDNIQLNSLALTGQKNVKMTGVVSADPFLLDIDLSQFMIDLENSPGFQQVQLVSKNRSSLQGEAVLDYEIQCVTE